MKRICSYLSVLFLMLITFAACDEHDGSFDKYANWQGRNVAYFKQVADSARNAISEAQKKYGADWEKHCDWRMFQSEYKADGSSATLADSICVRILNRGEEGGESPLWTDTVRVHYRGTLMPVPDIINGKDTIVQDVFDASFTPPLNLDLAYPRDFQVSATVVGFATALEYMHRGDRWMVYIPQELGYMGVAKDKIPAYSTLIFDITLVDFFRPNSNIPGWN